MTSARGPTRILSLKCDRGEKVLCSTGSVSDLQGGERPSHRCSGRSHSPHTTQPHCTKPATRSGRKPEPLGESSSETVPQRFQLTRGLEKSKLILYKTHCAQLPGRVAGASEPQYLRQRQDNRFLLLTCPDVHPGECEGPCADEPEVRRHWPDVVIESEELP